MDFLLWICSIFSGHQWRDAFVFCKGIVNFNCTFWRHIYILLSLFCLWLTLSSYFTIVSDCLFLICNSSSIYVSCVYNLKLCFFSNRVWFKQTLFSSFGVNDFKKPLKQELYYYYYSIGSYEYFNKVWKQPSKNILWTVKFVRVVVKWMWFLIYSRYWERFSVAASDS